MLICALPAAALAIDETRRQLGSMSLDHAFAFDGTGVVLGDVYLASPLLHTDVPVIRRPGDAPAPGDGGDSLHALETAGIMVSQNTTYTGMAPGATLYTDDYTNNGVAAGGGGTAGENNFLNALIYMSTPPVARAVNASLRLNVGNPDGTTKVTLGTDWWASTNDILFVKSAGNSGIMPITVPGDIFNGLTVGAVSNEDYQRQRAGLTPNTTSRGPVDRRWNILGNYSSWGTATTLSKPDLVAPGGRIDTDDPVGGNAGMEQGFTMPTGDILPANGWAASNTNAGGRTAPGAAYVGTSYAAPHVVGIAGQLYQAAPGTNHLAMKAVLMNSADKTIRSLQHGDPLIPADAAHGVFWRKSDPPWTAGEHGLDAQLGAGMVDAWSAAANLLPGAGGGRIGVKSGNLAANGAATTDIVIIPVGVDSRVVATVTWDRKVTQTYIGPHPPAQDPSQDLFTYAESADQAHFGLQFAGASNLEQHSVGGSVQHINAVVDQPGNYAVRIFNDGAGAGDYAVAWAVSPPDVDPGTQNVFFTVRDQIHRPRPERTAPTGDDRILEGRLGSTVRARSVGDSIGNPTGVESSIYKSSMDASTFTHRTGLEMGLVEAAGVAADDAINDISFGRDNIRKLSLQGGQVWFSVDTYATGLSPVGVGNPQTGVYSEATIVNEAAGDIFRSNTLLPGAGPITNQNRRTKNAADNDYLHPVNNLNTNTTYADSYYMGLTGPRTADNEDDVAGLEGLGTPDADPSTFFLPDNFIFFTLDRGSPSTTMAGPGGEPAFKTSDVLVARKDMPGVRPRVYATGAQLGLLDSDSIDGLLVQELSGLDAQGWPMYDPTLDYLVFSVDRDSAGGVGSALSTEQFEGESSGDLFYGNAFGTNSLFLEATDLGLQEFDFSAFPGEYDWLTDNLDALDIPDLVPEPPAWLLLGLAFAIMPAATRRRWAC